MRQLPSLRRLACLKLTAAAAGCLLMSSCLATMERGLDVILSPAASGNLLVAPYGASAGIIELLSRVFRG